MNSSTVIIAFTVFFVIWLVNTKRLARIVELYQGGNAPGGVTMDQPDSRIPKSPDLLKLDPPVLSGPVDSGAGARARAKKKRNPMYLPPVKL